MSRFFWICLAGAIGTGTRYLVSIGANRWLGPSFPYGTLIVNVVGCFLIAAAIHAAVSTSLVPDTLRLTLTVGFLGGLTTYSSFNYETTKLLHERAYGAASLNFALTIGGCFAAGILGMLVAKRIFGG